MVELEAGGKGAVKRCISRLQMHVWLVYGQLLLAERFYVPAVAAEQYMG